MKENHENWKKQLNTVIIEIAGMGEIFSELSSQFLELLSKLEGLNIKEDIEFEVYRKTVFETISILQEMRKKK